MEVQSQFIEMFGMTKDTKPLRDFISFSCPGEWGKEDLDKTGVKVIRTTNFTNDGHLDLSEVVSRDIEIKKIERKRLQKGDIILERSGGTADNPVGRVVYFNEEGEYLFNNFTQLLRCTENVESLYLFYSLFNYYHLNKNVIRSLGNKTTGIQNLKLEKYYEIPIVCASKELQQRFVQIYTQADKSKFDGFKSQFIEMFEGSEYPHQSLEEVASNWLKGQPFKKEEMTDDGNSTCIHYGELFTKYGPIINHVSSKTNSQPIKTSVEGDILFPASDVTPNGLARCSMLPFNNVILGGDIIILRPKQEYNAGYLSYAINQQTSQILTRVNGAVVKHISAKALKSVVIPIPPKDLQAEYILIANQADKSKSIRRCV